MGKHMNQTHQIEEDWQQVGAALYVQVRALIVQAIRSGEWKAGETIPPEKRLCERFGVSIGTLRKAVDELTTSGILVRRQGRGTFVAKHSEGRYLFSFFHLVLLDGRKEYPTVKFHDFAETEADEFMAAKLNTAVGAPVWHLQNVLSLGGKVSSVDNIYLPRQLFPNLNKETLVQRDTTLYQMYQDLFGLSVARAHECVEAFSSKPPYNAVLGVKAGTPLLKVIRTALALDDTVLELRISIVNTANCRYCPQAETIVT